MNRILNKATNDYKKRIMFWNIPAAIFAIIAIIFLTLAFTTSLKFQNSIGFICCGIVGGWFFIMGNFANKDVFKK